MASQVTNLWHHTLTKPLRYPRCGRVYCKIVTDWWQIKGTRAPPMRASCGSAMLWGVFCLHSLGPLVLQREINTNLFWLITFLPCWSLLFWWEKDHFFPGWQYIPQGIKGHWTCWLRKKCQMYDMALKAHRSQPKWALCRRIWNILDNIFHHHQHQNAKWAVLICTVPWKCSSNMHSRSSSG